MFAEVTSDYQEITVQGQVTYRAADPLRTAKLLNFALDAKRPLPLRGSAEAVPARHRPSPGGDAGATAVDADGTGRWRAANASWHRSQKRCGRRR